MSPREAEKRGDSSDDIESNHDFRNASMSSTEQKSERERQKVNAMLANPLKGLSHPELRKMGKDYALEHALVEPEDFRAFEIGAVLAQNPEAWEECEGLREDEKEVLRKEFSNRWSQPWLLYVVIIL
ncbi:hypothetical protein LTR66_011937, partial [Elasticomyces elasticus]